MFRWARTAAERRKGGSEGAEAGAMTVNADGEKRRQETTNVSGNVGGHASDASEQGQDPNFDDSILELWSGKAFSGQYTESRNLEVPSTSKAIMSKWLCVHPHRVVEVASRSKGWHKKCRQGGSSRG